MLHLETVAPETLDLIRKLMQEKCLEHFKLVGRTALALKLGHRTSVDIDLFSNKEFDPKEVAAAILLKT